jgi:hypothetical protein
MAGLDVLMCFQALGHTRHSGEENPGVGYPGVGSGHVCPCGLNSDSQRRLTNVLDASDRAQ